MNFVPIQNWPGKPCASRKRASFQSPFERRIRRLERELEHLGARNILIQAFLSKSQIRLDGWPYADARPTSPGVIVTFQNRAGESLSFPCDTYTEWSDNLYAVALGLEALRAVDRYGVTQRGEQYHGWKLLGPSSGQPVLDREWALRKLAEIADVDAEVLKGADKFTIDLAYKMAARLAHPDTGGSTEAFQTLQEAMRLIRQ